MNLLELLGGSLTDEASVSSIAAKAGGTNKQILKLITIALPILISYMTKNASKKEGAQSLLGALGQHDNTRKISQQVADADEVDGAKIIGHILGNDEPAVAGNLAKQTGMDPKQVAKVLAIMAPIVLSGLNAATKKADKTKKSGVDLSDGVDLTDVMGLLGGATGAKKSVDISDGIGIDDVAGLMGMFSGQKQSSSSASADAIQSLLGGMMSGGQAQPSTKQSAFDGTDLLQMLAGMM